MARRIERQVASLQRQVSQQRSKQQITPDPQTDEAAYLEWHYQQLSPAEKREHDLIIAEIAASPNVPHSPVNHEFDVVTDQTEINPSDHHINGCSCFRCVQARAMYRRLGLS